MASMQILPFASSEILLNFGLNRMLVGLSGMKSGAGSVAQGVLSEKP